MKQADVVKMSVEEFVFITGFCLPDIQNGVRDVLDLGVYELYITAGKKCAFYAGWEEYGFVDGFSVETVDSTGCGDAFLGAILYMNTHCPEASLRNKTRFANAVGALCSTKHGGIGAMLEMNEVYELLN